MDYDGSYHLIFSHPEMVDDLMRHFVGQDWVNDYDFTRIKRINAKFHHAYLSEERAKRRESDIIYQVRKKTGEFIYLYLIIEFQSTSDIWMAARVNTYVSLLHDYLIRENQLTQDHLLPPVFTIVLYNGAAAWQGATQLADLIDLPKKSSLRVYQPNIRYFLIDESRYQGDKHDSLSGILFQLDQCKNPSEIYMLLEKLAKRLKEPHLEKLNRDFSAWVKFVLELNRQLALDLTQVNTLSEVRHMLRENIKHWEDNIKKQALVQGEALGFKKGEELGISKGISQGISQGITQGRAQSLLRQASRKFQSLPGWAIDHIESAEEEELDRLTDEILTASSLEAWLGKRS